MKANRWKKLGILLGVLAVLFIAAVLMVPKLVDLNNYRDLIATKIEGAVGGKVNIGSVRWGIGKEIWIEVDGFSISDSALLPGDLGLARISAEISAIPLLSRKILIEKLELASPDATLRLKPALKTDTEAEAAEKLPESEPDKSTAPTPPPVEIAIEKVSIKNGKITIEDSITLSGHQRIHTFTDVEMEAKNLIPGSVIPFRMSLRDAAVSGLGAITAQGTFSGLTEAMTLKDSELSVKANLPSFDMDVIRPYVRDYEWIQGLRGVVAADLSFKGNLGGEFQSDGSIDLSRTLFEDPSSGDKIQPKAGTKIGYRITFSENRITIKDFTLMWASLSLKTAAVIEDLHQAPTLKNFTLTSELPLKELVYIMPWQKLGEHAGRVREILGQGGHITIEAASMPDMRLSRLAEQPESLISDTELSARFSGISAYTLPELPTIQEVEGSVRLENGVIRIHNLKGRVGTATLPSISAVIVNLLDTPEIQAQMKGSLVVARLTDKKMIKLLKPVGINRMAGTADLDLSLKLALAKPEDFQLNGTIGLRGFDLGTTLTPVSFKDIHLNAAIDADAVDISDCRLTVTVPAGEASPAGEFKIMMSGTVSDLRKRPKATLRRLKTSAISLPSLVSVVPWDALGKEREIIKQIFLAGGAISIEEMVTPSIDLTSPPKDVASLAKRSSAVIQVADINIHPGPKIPGIEDITGKVSLKKGVLNAEKLSLRHGPIALPDLNVRATHLFTQPKVDARLKGHIRLGASPIPRFKELLLAYGFKDATGDADVDLAFRYDHAKPKAWEAEGALALKNLHAISHPEGVAMRNLNADLSFKRKNRLDIDIRKLSTLVNESPVRITGRFSVKDADTFRIDAKARAKDLDLTHLVAISPILRAMELDLKGRVNLDVDVLLPSQNPAASRMTGMITTRGIGFHVRDAGLKIKELNTHLDLKGDTIYIRSMTASVNEQNLRIEGQTQRPLVEPRAQLKIKAADLDLDKLFPPEKKASGDAKASPPARRQKKAPGKKSASKSEKTEKEKLPLDLVRMIAQLHVEIAKLRYRGNAFQNVTCTADYQRGIVKSYDVKAVYGQSQIEANGALDLRNPVKIGFEVNPNIQGLPLASIEPLFGLARMPVQGPLSVTGKVTGRTGSVPELLTSLSGNLEATVGKGIYLETGVTTDLLSKILAITSVQSILTGDILRDVTSEGIPFDRIKTGIAIGDGNLTIRSFNFLSSAMNLSANGSIDLVKKNLDVNAELEPFGIIDKALGLVPFAGKLGQKFTRYDVSVSGPVEKPNIRLGAVRKVTNTKKKKKEKKSKGILPRLF